MRKILILCFVCLSALSYAQDITNTPFGKGIINLASKDSSWTTKVAFRFQTRYDGEYDPVYIEIHSNAHTKSMVRTYT